ncbi:flavodoxin family protein [Butyrivibrio proteoclasticus]|uniref:flavodoxin family protein n=1 Tax=Butyrivibrio proteoclasticus TaxID=43305 RepID=UPI00047BE108|nr:flavodoxin family protein [Butyrivibrio proteoclasticus]
MLKHLVIYASETGNTKKLAHEIYSSLPVPLKDKEIVDVRTWHGQFDAENYFVGFWSNRGSCSLEIIDILSSLHDKNVALFGTCGMGNTDEYFKSLEQNARVWISDDNYFVDSYFCQGKMPPEVRDKYESYRGLCEDSKLDMMLNFYNDALEHPNRHDLLNARLFVDNCLTRIKELDLAFV